MIPTITEWTNGIDRLKNYCPMTDEDAFTHVLAVLLPIYALFKRACASHDKHSNACEFLPIIIKFMLEYAPTCLCLQGMNCDSRNHRRFPSGQGVSIRSGSFSVGPTFVTDQTLVK